MAAKIRHKINILEMHSSLGFAGGQRNMISFAKFLNKDFFNVLVCGYLEGGSQEEKLKKLGITFCSAKGDLKVIEKFIADNKIDAIHMHRSGQYIPFETEIFNIAKRINPNVVIIEKNVFGKYDGVSSKEIDCSFFQSIMHLNERYLSNSGLKFDFGKMKVLYNIIDATDFEQYRLSVEGVAAYKQSLGVELKDFVIGKIARPHIAKWSDLILDMMPHLIKLVPNVKFIIMGVPESRVKLIKKSNFGDRVIILPETANEKEVHKFYQVIDVLAHSSKIGECNGNTINEAMFWGKPVVVNSTPKRDNGQLEQIIHMQDGIVANYPQTFARALAYLYYEEAKRREMGESAKNKVLFLNNPEKIVKQLEKVFVENLDKIDPDSSFDYLRDVSYSPSEKDIIG